MRQNGQRAPTLPGMGGVMTTRFERLLFACREDSMTGHSAKLQPEKNKRLLLPQYLMLGASAHEAVHDVGGGIRFGSVVDLSGNVVGVMSEPEA